MAEDPKHGLKPGARVRLERGLLMGKEGIVSSDAIKGYYKVKVGPMEVSVSSNDLSALS